MNNDYSIYGNSEFAVIRADFAVIECLLQDERAWGAAVLAQAGDFHWRARLLERVSGRWFGSKIVPQSPSQFLAYGAIGVNSWLSYQVERETEETIRLIPAGVIPTRSKVLIVLLLAVPAVLPILLLPAAWRLLEIYTQRLSRLYLDATCRYLQQRLATNR